MGTTDEIRAALDPNLEPWDPPRRRTYIPLGCDQQGRLEDGQRDDSVPWSPADLCVAGLLVLVAWIGLFVLAGWAWAR